MSGGTGAVIARLRGIAVRQGRKGVAKGNRNEVEGKTFVGYYDSLPAMAVLGGCIARSGGVRTVTST